MKSIYFLLIFLFFLTACSSITKKEKIFKHPEAKNLKKYYENWNLEKAREELFTLIKKNPLNNNFKVFIVKIEKREDQKKEFYIVLEEIIEDFSKNKTESLKKYTKKTIGNKAKLKYLKGQDLSIFDIFASKAKFKKNSSKVIIALSYLDETFYMDVEFRIKEKGWKIENIAERR